jgi:hypothetical protein
VSASRTIRNNLYGGRTHGPIRIARKAWPLTLRQRGYTPFGTVSLTPLKRLQLSLKAMGIGG